MEVLMVLGIIGLVLAVAVPSFVAAWRYGQRETTKMELRSLQAALELYRGEKESYPESLADVVKTKYIPAGGEKDAWDRPYLYQRTDEGYILRSSGPNGKPNDEDDIVLR